MADQKYPSASRLNLPRHPGEFLYVAQLENGLKKVGSTRQPRERALQLQRLWKQAVTRMVVRQIPEDSHRFNTERVLVGRLHKRARPAVGREYFDDVSFDELVAAITEAAADPEPSGRLIPYFPRVTPKSKARRSSEQKAEAA